MKLENWGDLFKYSKELLDDDYNHGQSLVVKTKSKATDNITELSTTFKQGSPDEKGESKVGFEAKFKTANGQTTHETSAKQDGSVSYELKTPLENLFKVNGLNFVANTSASTVGSNPEFKVGFEYTSSKFRAKTLTNIRTLLGETSWTYLARSNFAIGGQFNLNLSNSNLDKYDFGFSWNPASSAFVGLKHESTNKKTIEFGRFLLNVNHAANSSQTVGTEFALDWQKKSVEARLGLLHRFNDDTSGKFKVNQCGCVDAVLKHRLNNTVTLNFVTGFCLTQVISESKSQKLPLGLTFDLKL